MKNNNQKIYVDWIDRVKVLQKAIVKNEEGLILMLKRTDDERRPRPGCWDLPGGRVEVSDIKKWKQGSGCGDENDILINALCREIKEETGLEVARIHAVHSASAFSETKKVLIVAIGYACETTDKSKIKLSGEHCEHKWIHKDDLATLDIGDDGGLIASIFDKI